MGGAASQWRVCRRCAGACLAGGITEGPARATAGRGRRAQLLLAQLPANSANPCCAPLLPLPHATSRACSTWEWATVKRPGPDGRPRSVRLPLGSLRASLGSMSRFEDAYALATFLERHYTDASSDAEVAASVAAEVPAELRAQRMARLTWAHPSDPGWC